MPEQAAQQARQELRDADEGDEADRRQRVGAAAHLEVEKSEAEHGGNGDAAREQQQRAHVAAHRPAGRQKPQRHRHDDMVGDHGRDGDRRDDHHRGGGGEAAEEGEERELVALFGERQGQHEEVRVGPLGHHLQADDGDRHDEEGHAEEVEREQPGGGRQVPFLDVLDHGDLELPRQADDRRRREEGQRHPAWPEDVLGADDHLGRHVGEDVVEAVGDDEGGEDADREQRAQLDDRLQRDRRDDAVVTLVRVQVPGAEQNGEKCHAGGDPERGRHPVRLAGDDLVAAGDALQLQGDVGRRGDHRDDGDQHGEAGALAIAGRDQVGDRGDAVRPADADQLAQQPPPADEDQGRAEIDGDEFEPAARRGADGAIKGPRGAIDRNREGVDQRRLQPGDWSRPRASVDDEGDGEEQGDVAEADRQQDVEGKHQPAPSGSELRAGSASLASKGPASIRAPAISAAQTAKT